MKKNIITVLPLLFCLFILTSCGNKTEKTTTIVLDWTPNTNHTGIFVAQERGFFKDLGLNVEIVQAPEDGAEALTAAGKADFGISFQDSIAPAFTKENQLPVTAVATILQHNTSGIVSLEDNNINSPKDLQGKNYATWDLPVEKAMLKSVVEKDGGDFSKVNLIPSTVTDIISALNTNVDSVWIFYGWDGIALETKKTNINYFAFSDMDPTFDYYTPIIIANNEYLKTNSEDAKRFLKALEMGYEYCIDNPKEATEILLKQSPELDRDIVFASQEYLANEYMADSPRWGYIDNDRWNGFYEWLYDNNLIESKIEKDFGFTNEFLPE